MTLRHSFKIGQELTLKTGKSPRRDDHYDRGRTWSEITDLPAGTTARILDINGNTLSLIATKAMAGNKDHPGHKKGYKFKCIADAWKPKGFFS